MRRDAAALIAMDVAIFAMVEVRIAVIGDASFAELLAEQFDDSGVRGFFFATWCSPDTSVEALKATLARKRIDLVVIENRVLGSIEVEHAVDACVELGVRLTDGVTLYERVLGHVPVAVIRSAWFRAVLDPERPATRVRLRRVRDIQIALMVAVVAAPVMLVDAAAVAICDGRPIFFRQRRIGKGGREFRLLKFRTMRSDPRPGASWATPDDPRITSLGGWLRKLHLDELPQLINVLRGEMTLVAAARAARHRRGARAGDPLLLAGLVTRDLTRVPRGRIAYGALTDDHGKMTDDCTCMIRSPDSVRFCGANDRDYALFTASAEGTPITVTEQTAALPHLCLQGPASRGILQGLTDADLSGAAFPYYTFREDVRIAGIPVFMTRLGYTAELGFELWVAQDRCLELWDALLAAGTPAGMRVIGMDALDLFRIEGGFIIGGVEYDPSVSPYECGLGWSVDLDKANLRAADALRRDREAADVRLTSVVLESGGAAASGAALAAGGEPVGLVTQAVVSPHLGGATLGLAKIRTHLAEPGTPRSGRGALEAQAARLSLGRRVRFLGKRTDVARVLAAADIGVLCSDREGTPLAVLEYMQAGLAIVATAVGGIPAAVRHEQEGLLVPPGSAEVVGRASHACATTHSFAGASARPPGSAVGASSTSGTSPTRLKACTGASRPRSALLGRLTGE